MNRLLALIVSVFLYGCTTENTASLTLINKIDQGISSISVQMSKTRSIESIDTLAINKSHTFKFEDYQDDSYIISLLVNGTPFLDTLGYLIGGYVFNDTGIIQNDSIKNIKVKYSSHSYQRVNPF